MGTGETNQWKGGLVAANNKVTHGGGGSDSESHCTAMHRASGMSRGAPSSY